MLDRCTMKYIAVITITQTINITSIQPKILVLTRAVTFLQRQLSEVV